MVYNGQVRTDRKEAGSYGRKAEPDRERDYFVRKRAGPHHPGENLYKIYKIGTNKVYALNGVDFTMYKGEFCAIVGRPVEESPPFSICWQVLRSPLRERLLLPGSIWRR